MSFDIRQGDWVDVLRTMPDESVHCAVTSPPYWGLRDYGTAAWIDGREDCDHVASELRRGVNLAESVHSTRGGAKKVAKSGGIRYLSVCAKCGAVRIDRQLGLERSPEEYIAKMVQGFREVRRVLRSDGTLWLNMGDSYSNDTKWGGTSGGKNYTSAAGGYQGQRVRRGKDCDPKRGIAAVGQPNQSAPGPLKPKDMVGMPWRVAFALHADGWWLRSEIIWSKRNPMPESVTDRPTKSHEHIFLLTKSGKYFYDAEAIKEPVTGNAHERGDGVNPKARGGDTGVGWGTRGQLEGAKDGRYKNKKHGQHSRIQCDRDPRHLRYPKQPKQNESFSGAVAELVTSRNKRSVWEVATSPFPEAHFATFPPKLIEPCILAGTSERGCCAECGAPWERIVEPSEEYAKHLGKRVNGYDYDRDAVVGMKIGEKANSDYRTIGWQPTCKCGTTEAVPCVVLDPFNGAGTTGLVARRLHRHYLGIELNPQYIAMAERRIVGDAPLFNSPSKESAGDARPSL